MKNKIIKNGFTLLEIIAVISITAIITAIVTASFILTSRTLMIANQFILEENEKMRIYSVLEKQLLCVYYSDSLKFSLYGSETVTSDYSNNSNIEFLTSSPVNGEGIVQAMYSIRKNNKGRNILSYCEYPYPIGPCITTGSKKKEIVLNWIDIGSFFSGLDIHYFEKKDDETGYNTWDRQYPPEKIKITLKYQGGEGEKDFSFHSYPCIKIQKQ